MHQILSEKNSCYIRELMMLSSIPLHLLTNYWEVCWACFSNYIIKSLTLYLLILSLSKKDKLVREMPLRRWKHRVGSMMELSAGVTGNNGHHLGLLPAWLKVLWVPVFPVYLLAWTSRLRVRGSTLVGNEQEICIVSSLYFHSERKHLSFILALRKRINHNFHCSACHYQIGSILPKLT